MTKYHLHFWLWHLNYQRGSQFLLRYQNYIVFTFCYLTLLKAASILRHLTPTGSQGVNLTTSRPCKKTNSGVISVSDKLKLSTFQGNSRKIYQFTDNMRHCFFFINTAWIFIVVNWYTCLITSSFVDPQGPSVQILSFWCTNFSKHRRVGIWRCPPPPTPRGLTSPYM